MSCFNSNCYLPQPPRAWSRVQNSCSLITDTDNNGLVRDPYTGQFVTAVVLAERIAMLNKGNVLQYKANSSNLTKSQKYSKIAKGQWVNRNTTWATQSTRGYTNPNTTSLKRDGNINIAIDPITGAIIGPTAAPPTCPQPVIPVNEGLPSNGGGGSSIIDPEIPPPVEPTPGSDVFPVIIADIPPEPIVIQDGGNLICSVQENICTGETKSSLSQQLCHPTTDSDVPGPIQDLCWNDGTQTWYPRQRYVMTNSANKWPVNAELAGAIIINPPYIISVSSDRNTISLTWSFDSSCLPASNFNIYQNGLLVRTVSSNTFTTIFTVDNCNTYEYYIKAENITAKAVSEASNVVSIPIYYVEPPTNLAYTTTGSGSIQLTWGLPNPNCKPAVSYKIYQDGIFINNTVFLNETVNLLTNCDSYTFSVTSVDSEGNESLPAILNNVIPLWPNPPTNITWQPLDGGIILNWIPPVISCTTFNYYEIIVKDSPGGAIIQTLTTINSTVSITGLINCNIYDFEITTVDTNMYKSLPILLTQQILWPSSPGNITGVAGDGSCQISWTAPTTDTCSNYYITQYNGEYIGGILQNNITSPYIFNGLINGTSYTFNIYTVAIINGYTCVSTNPSTIILTPNVYYTLGGGVTGVSGTSGGYNYVYINTAIGGGLITFNLGDSYVSTVYVVCVAGGGGGGGAGDLGGSTDSGRGGGGAGCGVIQINSPIVNNSYVFNVGVGGIGGSGDEVDGGDGGDSLLLNPYGTTLIYCTSGKGGGSGPTGSANGAAGQQTIPSSANGGGQGGQNPGDGGSNSSTVGTPLSITGLSSLPSPFSTSYGGGGGCGNASSNGGGSGNNGVGGGGTSAPNATGQTATTAGSGGGGAGWTSSGVNYAGGNGAIGLIGFWWQPLF